MNYLISLDTHKLVALECTGFELKDFPKDATDMIVFTQCSDQENLSILNKVFGEMLQNISGFSSFDFFQVNLCNQDLSVLVVVIAIMAIFFNKIYHIYFYLF